MADGKDNLKQKAALVGEQVKKHKMLLILSAIPVGFVAFNFISSDHKPAQMVKSSISSADHLHSNLEGNLSKPYLEKLKAQKEAQLAEAKKTNSSFIPSIAGMTTVNSASDKGAHQNLTPEEDQEEQAAPPKAQTATIVDSMPSDDAPDISIPDVNTPKIRDQNKDTQPQNQNGANGNNGGNTGNLALVRRNVNYITKSRYELLQKQMEQAADMDEHHNQSMEGNAAIAVSSPSSIAIASNSSSGIYGAGTERSIGPQSGASQNQAVNHFKTPVDGTTWRGHFTSPLDSREPMKVYGKIESGPYKGSMVIGSFQTNGEAHKLTIRFNEIVYRYEDDDGVVQTLTGRINAVAIDPSSGMTGFADYVNRHTLQKVLLPLATSFASGLGQAISQSGSSSMMSASGGSVISQGSKNLQQQMLQAMGSSANQATSVFQSMYGNVQDEITVNSGHGFVMVFESSGQ